MGLTHVETQYPSVKRKKIKKWTCTHNWLDHSISNNLVIMKIVAPHVFSQNNNIVTKNLLPNEPNSCGDSISFSQKRKIKKWTCTHNWLDHSISNNLVIMKTVAPKCFTNFHSNIVFWNLIWTDGSIYALNISFY